MAKKKKNKGARDPKDVTPQTLAGDDEDFDVEGQEDGDELDEVGEGPDADEPGLTTNQPPAPHKPSLLERVTDAIGLTHHDEPTVLPGQPGYNETPPSSNREPRQVPREGAPQPGYNETPPSSNREPRQVPREGAPHGATPSLTKVPGKQRKFQ